MKRVKLFAVVVLACLSMISCNNENNENADYAGTYSGPMSMTGVEKSINAKLTFINLGSNLTLYGAQLTKTSETTYTAKSDLLKAAIFLIAPDAIEQQIENLDAKFTFSGNQVTMYLTYNLMGIAEVKVITFNGTK
jgi:hypothetical protein